ncbi:conserved hypothetical protein (plasmid) [Gloeothece citriformis PCC 7424]|uniref:Uncharacterized protein n=1 Tax=Gloeothece citriformis (strain PCC 7424) TaxID=65393 RepID=B7KMI3_GLOC7|nr:hypothetical protein [Gloeothece citriformis]ACK74005.1 conserved hypothetical protein [Gloeothece citriformis PCC 7424]
MNDDSPAVNSKAVEVVGDDIPTPQEEEDLQRLEKIVECSFLDAGLALQEINTRKLYRFSHKTFEDYCRDRFGYLNRRHPYRLIEAALVVENLLKKCDQIGHKKIPMPNNEAQVRPLTQLDEEQQWEAWENAVTESKTKVPSAAFVKKSVEELKQRVREKANVPFPYKVNDVCKIIVKENPQLRGKSGHWGIIVEVMNFSANIQLADGIYQVKEENLEELSYTPDLRDKAKIICDRLYKLSQHELEKSSKVFIVELGASPLVVLSNLQEQILQLIEKNVDCKGNENH